MDRIIISIPKEDKTSVQDVFEKHYGYFVDLVDIHKIHWSKTRCFYNNYYYADYYLKLKGRL